MFLVMAVSSIHAGTADAALLKDFVAAEATLVGADVATALHIVHAESNFNPQAIGDHGESYGMWQIHLPAHKDISTEQAQDAVFSTEWAVGQLKQGNGHIWSTFPKDSP